MHTALKAGMTVAMCTYVKISEQSSCQIQHSDLNILGKYVQYHKICYITS